MGLMVRVILSSWIATFSMWSISALAIRLGNSSMPGVISVVLILTFTVMEIAVALTLLDHLWPRVGPATRRALNEMFS